MGQNGCAEGSVAAVVGSGIDAAEQDDEDTRESEDEHRWVSSLRMAFCSCRHGTRLHRAVEIAHLRNAALVVVAGEIQTWYLNVVA